MVNDVDSTLQLADAIIDVCYECKDWTALMDNITLLCKRRAQHQRVVTSMIRKPIEWLEDTPTEQVKRQLIECLRLVSSGKIFVELERARLTRTLAEMEERDGNVNEAAEILHDVQVETIGSMEIREKAEFLLEQMRLCLAKKDFVRAQIISRKVKADALETDDMQELKLKYYRLMIQSYLNDKDYFSVCKAYHAIFRTKSVQDDGMEWPDVLRRVVMYLVLSPFDSEVSDLLHRVYTEKRLEELEHEKLVLKQFTTAELIQWPLQCDTQWKDHQVFSSDNNGSEDSKVESSKSSSSKSNKETDDTLSCYQLLQKRTVQHNIRTIAGYYQHIRTSRLAELLLLSQDKAEEFLSELVSSKQLFARIDRPAGIVTFVPKETPSTTLNAWAHDVSSLMSLIDETCHLINKENMVHKLNV
jgi:26S proteasome regulatory subunit N5